MSENTRKKPISTNLEAKTIEKLKKVAKQRAISVAAVIRQAVLKFLKEDSQ